MNNKIIIISLRIILMFTAGILMSFLPELFPNFFGDVYCTIIGSHDGIYWEASHIHWGYRHWLYFFMGLSLFIVQFVSFIVYINIEEIKK